MASYTTVIILRLVAIGCLGSLFYQILYFSSYRTITALTGSVLTRLGNIFFVVASIFFLKEKHSMSKIFAVILAVIGAILSAAKPSARLEFSLTTGFWLMVVATILSAGYNFANNAIKKTWPNARVNLFIYKVGTLIIISLWAILTNTKFFPASSSWQINLHPPLRDLFTPFVIGAFADGIGFLAWLKLLELGDSVEATIVSAVVAVAQVILSVLIFKEDASLINAGLAPALVIIPITWMSIVDARAKNKAGKTRNQKEKS
jgi:drug/metabolite transporter (DMT)-like permease